MKDKSQKSFFLKKKKDYLCVYVCMNVCIVCVTADGGHGGALDALELELQAFVSYPL